jgi:hypothetical protein
MRNLGLTLGAGAAAIALIAAQPAWAVQSFAEFTGTATVTDATNFFGNGTSYTTSFDLTFSVNDATAGSSIISASLPGVPAATELMGSDLANPVRGTLILGIGPEVDAGHDYIDQDSGADAFGQVLRVVAESTIDPSLGFLPGGTMAYFTQSLIQDPGFTFKSYLELQINSPSNFGLGGIGVDYNHPFTYNFGADDSVQFADGEYFDGDPNNPTFDVKFSLAPTSVTITSNEPTGGVPEPATWALMIAGFGGVGAALRRRGGQRARVLLQ